MRIQLHLFLPDGSIPTRLHPRIPRSLYSDESNWAGETQEFHTFTALSKEIPLFTNDTKELKHLQNEDPYFGPLIQFLEGGTLPLERGDRALLRSQSRLMFLDKEGILYHVTNPPLRASRRGTPGLALCIPDGLRRRALEAVHDDLFSAHCGTKKVKGTLLERFWWPTIGTLTLPTM